MRRIPFLVLALSLLTLAACGGAGGGDQTRSAGPEISGRIEDGLRVLSFDPTAGRQDFTIFRGDYVRPEVLGGGRIRLISEDLGLDGTFPPPAGEKPYFKVPEVGSFSYRSDSLQGVIEAVDYRAARYREVNAREAADILASLDPFILDVRTSWEFKSGHLAGATLIPVQTLQRRMAELEAHKERPVFIYCRTGNRSTVAARMLINSGFQQVINLRRGIVEWQREGLPVQK